jgi:hypothetical protein
MTALEFEGYNLAYPDQPTEIFLQLRFKVEMP